MVIIKIEELPKIRSKYKNKKIVFCSGSFDLTHAGHILFFEDCKKYGDILVVAVGRDSSLRKEKGEKRPILNERIRLKTVDSFKPVDFTFINTNEKTSGEEKFETLRIAFENLRPEVYVINEDAFDIETRKELCENYSVKLEILKRWSPPEFDGISTTKIIQKIKELV